MATKLDDLKTQYAKIPQELKSLRRWCAIVGSKKPIDVRTGKEVEEIDDSSLCADFNDALAFIQDKKNAYLGFALGNGLFGVDIDSKNGSNPISQSEFQDKANSVVKMLNSYTEWSQSGDGIHIICKGKAPIEGGDNGIRFYDRSFFIMTGNAIRARTLAERTKEAEAVKNEFIGDNAFQDERAIAEILDGTPSEPAKEKHEFENRKFIPEMNLDDDGEPIFRMDESALNRHKEYTLDDTGNAERFHDLFGNNFRWNVDENMFMFWTGKVWVVDTTNILRKYVNYFVNLLREEADSMVPGPEKNAFDKNIQRIANKAGKDAMIAEFKSIGGTSITNGELNKDPFLLNTQSGVVDLRTGEIKPFDREGMFSKITGCEVSYDEPTAFNGCLDAIFERGNAKETKDIKECFIRSLGYTATGLEDEQVMFLLYGDTGSNGKSTVVNVIRSVFGDYAKPVDSSNLMSDKNRNAEVQYALAELPGIRFLSTQETERGAQLNESLIKQLTGGDEITARRIYARPFSFIPTFKVWLMTNNLPIIHESKYAVWRRFYLFPFVRTFAGKMKDRDMPTKLAAEEPKILGLIIKGAVEYLKKHDLEMPECMAKELNVYREDMDTISRFISDVCKQDKEAMTAKNDVYKAYGDWAKATHAYWMPEQFFMKEMVKKEYNVYTNKTTGVKYYVGIRVSNPVDGSAPYIFEMAPTKEESDIFGEDEIDG